jgi:hypothetical protein
MEGNQREIGVRRFYQSEIRYLNPHTGDEPSSDNTYLFRSETFTESTFDVGLVRSFSTLIMLMMTQPLQEKGEYDNRIYSRFIANYPVRIGG